MASAVFLNKPQCLQYDLTLVQLQKWNVTSQILNLNDENITENIFFKIFQLFLLHFMEHHHIYFAQQ